MKRSKRFLVVVLSLALLAGVVATGAGALAPEKHWVGSWSAGMTNISISLLEGQENSDGLRLSAFAKNMTARIRLTPTLGGDRLRFCLSNENGTAPLVLHEVSIARAAGDSGSSIVEGSSIPVTFGGSREVTIPAGEIVYCDPVEMEVHALEDLCVTYYVQDFGRVETMALYGGTTYLTLGNKTESTDFVGLKLSFGTLVSVVPLLSGLDVYADEDAYSIVVIGDSTTSNDIPKLLAKRIIEETGENKVGVLQKSIVGNCLLNDGAGAVGNIYGKAMLSRFQKDALEQPGVKYTLVKIGLNDILHPLCKSMEGIAPKVTAEDVIAGYRQLIEMAHHAGVKIVFAESSPWKGYTRDLLKTGNADLEWTPEAQQMCDDLTQWIRTTEESDGSINLDCLKDPEDPTKMPDGYTSDGAHLLPPAQEAFVASIDLSLFGVDVSQAPSVTETTQQDVSEPAEEPVSTTAAPAVEETLPEATEPETGAETLPVDDATAEEDTDGVPAPLEIADTGDSLMVGGAMLAVLSACGLLLVTRKRK